LWCCQKRVRWKGLGSVRVVVVVPEESKVEGTRECKGGCGGARRE
jgi:hypothetical protein